MQLAYTDVREGPVILPLPLQGLEPEGGKLVPAAALFTRGTEEPLEHREDKTASSRPEQCRHLHRPLLSVVSEQILAKLLTQEGEQGLLQEERFRQSSSERCKQP